MKRNLAVFFGATVALVLLAGSGVVHGLLTDRWTTGAELQQAADSLNAVPATVGDWQSEPVEIPERQLKQAEAINHFSRHYINRKTGESVTVLIVCGRPGPISVHPPTVCFTSAGWVLMSEPRRFTVPDAAASTQFWVGDFTKGSSAGQTSMRTFWSWTADGKWNVPDNPRFAFARHPFLYKMYVLRSLARSDTPAENDPALPFLRLFLQELDRTLEKSA